LGTLATTIFAEFGIGGSAGRNISGKSSDVRLKLQNPDDPSAIFPGKSGALKLPDTGI
jgi:hypothetical protein